MPSTKREGSDSPPEGAPGRGRAALDRAQRNAARLRQAAGQPLAQHITRADAALTGLQARHVARLMGGHADQVDLVIERHRIALLWPVVAAVTTVVVALISSAPFGWVALIAAVSVLVAWPEQGWTRAEAGLRILAVEVLVLLVATLTSPVIGRIVLVIVGPAYLVWGLVAWKCDLLVFTSTHYWRLLGVIGTDSPKVQLNSLRFTEVQQGALGRLAGWGTLRFDTPVQKDQRLHEFGPVGDPHNQMATIDALLTGQGKKPGDP